MTDHQTLPLRGMCAVALTVLASVIALLICSNISVSPSDHERKILANLPSPTGEWTASVSEEVAENGRSYKAIDRVAIQSTAYPTWSIDLLLIDKDGHRGNPPRIIWSAPNALSVTAPNLLRLRMLTRHAQAVDLDVRFEPDDPAARAVWLKRIREDPSN
jgi:hypothetical protein